MRGNTYMAYCHDCHEFNNIKRQEEADDQCPCSSTNISCAEECELCHGFGHVNEGFSSGEYKEIEKVECPDCMGSCYTYEEKKLERVKPIKWNYDEIFGDIFSAHFPGLK